MLRILLRNKPLTLLIVLLVGLWAAGIAVDKKVDDPTLSTYEHISPKLIDRIDIHFPTAQHVVLKAGELWHINDKALEADDVTKLFGFSDALGKRNFVTYRKEKYAKYGLDVPNCSVDYWVGRLQAIHLTIGKWDPEKKKTFILLDKDPHVYSVDLNLLELFRRLPD